MSIFLILTVGGHESNLKKIECWLACDWKFSDIWEIPDISNTLARNLDIISKFSTAKVEKCMVWWCMMVWFLDERLDRNTTLGELLFVNRNFLNLLGKDSAEVYSIAGQWLKEYSFFFRRLETKPFFDYDVPLLGEKGDYFWILLQ